MQESKLYVGNLNYTVTSEQLKQKFEEVAPVSSANIITGKGFGFVEMESVDGANKAKESLNGQEFSGRTMKIDFARPPKQRKRGERRSFSNSRNRY